MAVSDEERHRIEEILEEDVFKGKTVRLIGMRENRGISENTNAAIKGSCRNLYWFSGSG